MYRREDIEHLRTLSVGQSADLKINTGTFRVWLCRVTGRVECERWDPNARDGRGQWVETENE